MDVEYPLPLPPLPRGRCDAGWWSFNTEKGLVIHRNDTSGNYIVPSDLDQAHDVCLWRVWLASTKSFTDWFPTLDAAKVAYLMLLSVDPSLKL